MSVQKLQNDTIGALAQNSGSISLAPSVLTIGGQQYITTATLFLTVGTLTANALYLIYAVASVGVVSLVSSLNVNSVGPATYTSWKLVGAFYTNASGTFDSLTDLYSHKKKVLCKTSNTSGNPGVIPSGFSELNATLEIGKTYRFTLNLEWGNTQTNSSYGIWIKDGSTQFLGQDLATGTPLVGDMLFCVSSTIRTMLTTNLNNSADCGAAHLNGDGTTKNTHLVIEQIDTPIINLTSNPVW
jgi:hypothetical protein